MYIKDYTGYYFAKLLKKVTSPLQVLLRIPLRYYSCDRPSSVGIGTLTRLQSLSVGRTFRAPTGEDTHMAMSNLQLNESKLSHNIYNAMAYHACYALGLTSQSRLVITPEIIT